MEVAIKMALRLWDVRVRTGKIKNQIAIGDSEETGDHMKNVIVLTQKDCYHGKSTLDWYYPLSLNTSLLSNIHFFSRCLFCFLP